MTIFRVLLLIANCAVALISLATAKASAYVMDPVSRGLLVCVAGVAAGSALYVMAVPLGQTALTRLGRMWSYWWGAKEEELSRRAKSTTANPPHP